eukprot:GEMP01021705.1.p1 GENE.GEMP01021705.1~~GEMP01021705.1.p1  ORF type:complete len:484 (+),score=90.54 GEMP01021705.1:549-2000(+)
MPRSEEQHMYDFEYLEAQPPAPPPKKVNVKRKPHSSSQSPAHAVARGERGGDGGPQLSPRLLDREEMTTIFGEPSGWAVGKRGTAGPAWPKGADSKGWKASYARAHKGDGWESPWGVEGDWGGTGWMMSSPLEGSGMEARDPSWAEGVDWKGWKAASSSKNGGLKEWNPMSLPGAGWGKWASSQRKGTHWEEAPQSKGVGWTGWDSFPEGGYNKEWDSLQRHGADWTASDSFPSKGTDEDWGPKGAGWAGWDSFPSQGADSEEWELLQSEGADMTGVDDVERWESSPSPHGKWQKGPPSPTADTRRAIIRRERKTAPNRADGSPKTLPSRKIRGTQGRTPSPPGADGRVRAAAKIKSSPRGAVSSSPTGSFPRKNLLARVKSSPPTSPPRASPAKGRTPSPPGADGRVRAAAKIKSSPRGALSSSPSGSFPRKNLLARVKSSPPTSPPRASPAKVGTLSSASRIRTKGRKLSPASSTPRTFTK